MTRAHSLASAQGFFPYLVCTPTSTHTQKMVAKDNKVQNALMPILWRAWDKQYDHLQQQSSLIIQSSQFCCVN